MNGAMGKELETSVRNEDVATVRRILANGGELDYLNDYGMTLLGMAADAGQKEVVLLLLALGADPDEDDYEGETAVTYALYNKHYETLFCLLASKDEAVGARRCVDLLRWAAAYGDVYCMERLLDGGVFVDALDEEGSTALIYAASNSKYEAVQFLLARGADVTIRSKGVTALYHATRHEALDVAALLRKAGAQIELTEAAMIGDISTVMALLDRGAEPNACDHNGDRPLNFAAYRGHTDTVRLLMKRGADPCLSDSSKETAFWQACMEDRAECAVLLLKFFAEQAMAPHKLKAFLLGATAEIDAFTTYSHQTPLMEAVASDKLQLAQLLLQAGADVNIQNPKGFTALMYAAQKGHIEIVRLLLEAGAKVNVKNSTGISILEEAIGGGHTEVEALLRSVGALEGWVRLPDSPYAA